MSVTLLVCLVFLTKILAYDSVDSFFESPIDHIDNIKYDLPKNTNHFGRHNYIRKIISEHHETANSITKEPLEETNDTKKPANDKEGLNTENSNAVISYPPYTQYEVTEIVSDIPDDRTPGGPIVTNFTARPPLLNTVKPNLTDTDKLKEANIKTKKNRVSILHINAEYDDKVNEVSGNKVIGIFKGIKEYIHNFHRGVVNGIHSFFHKHDHDHKERAVDNVNHDESNDLDEERN